MQTILDATGVCCSGIVDNFGVCNGYDSSGGISLSLGMDSSSPAIDVASYLGVDPGSVSVMGR